MAGIPILTPLSADYYPDIYRLLEAADLPNEDIDDMDITFWGVLEDEKVIGVIGLQVLGDVGLMRSLAVANTHQGQAWAEELIKELLKHCQILQLHAVFLLTRTTQRYFHHRGFMEISHDHLPVEIKQSRDYQEFCTPNAVAMYMPLV